MVFTQNGLSVVLGSSDGGATSVCGGNLSDSTAEGAPPTLDAYDTDAASLVSSAHHIYQRKYNIVTEISFEYSVRYIIINRFPHNAKNNITYMKILILIRLANVSQHIIFPFCTNNFDPSRGTIIKQKVFY